MVEEVDVEGVASLSEFGLEMVRAVKICLKLEVRSLVQHAFPSTQQISSRQVRRAISVHLRGGRIERVRGPIAGALAVDVTLKRKGIASAAIPVCAETGLAHSPLIEDWAVWVKVGPAEEAQAVHAIVEGLTSSAPVLSGTGTLVNIAPPQRYHRPACIPTVLGDDIDDPVDGIRSPNRAAWPSDYLNAFDVVEWSSLSLPIDAREQRRVNTPSVNQNEQFAG